MIVSAGRNPCKESVNQMKLQRDFYLRSCLDVAPELIGKQLVHHCPEGTAKGVIVEVEAYRGPSDAAAHSYGARRTRRTEIQYGIGGFAYLYTIYGLHLCMNVVTGPAECPEVVLIRALRPVQGLDLMRRRRKKESIYELCNGPGKLTQALGIQKTDYGADLCGSQLYLESGPGPAPVIAATRRINIDYAGEAVNYLWRFVERDSPFLSAPPRR